MKMKRVLLAVGVVLLVVAGIIVTAQAQAVQCLPGFHGLEWAWGMFPADQILVCSTDGDPLAYVKFQRQIEEAYPCGSQYQTYSWQSLSGGNTALSVWTGRTMNNEGRVRFIVATKGRYFFSPPDYDGRLGFAIEYYTSQGTRTTSESHWIHEYPRAQVQTTKGGYPFRYYVYWVDELFETAADQPSGYVTLVFSNEADVYLDLPRIPDLPISFWEYGDYNVSSLQVARSDYLFPGYCEVDDNPGAPTATPGAWPTSTGEPMPTWGGTLTPQATATFPPVVFPTVRGENTPTPVPGVSLPPVSFSTPPLPTVDAVGGGGGSEPPPTTDWSVLTDGLGVVATRWYTATHITIGLDDTLPITHTDQVDVWYRPGYTMTNPYLDDPGIGDGDFRPRGDSGGMLEQIPAYIRSLVGFWKMIQQLMPHFWPLISGIFALFFSGILLVVLIFAYRLALAAAELLRRIIELIPGM